MELVDREGAESPSRRGLLKLLGAGGAGAALVAALPAGSAQAAPAHESAIVVSPRDYGAVGDGSADDTEAVQAALTAAAGATVVLDGAFRITADVTVSPFTAVRGLGGNGVVDTNVSVYDSFARSSLVLDGGSTVHVLRGAVLDGFALLRAGLLQPANTVARARTMLSQYRGTAITSRGFDASDIVLSNLSIFGHDLAVDIDGSDPTRYAGRSNLTNIRIDCLQGVRIKDVADVARITSVHAWPFLTYIGGVSNADPASYDILGRPGAAFTVIGACDWAQLMQCFSYGYNYSVIISGASNIQLIDHQADNVQVDPSANTGKPVYRTAGVLLRDDSENLRMINCTVVSHPTAVQCAVGGSRSARKSVIVTGGLFICFAKAIDLVSGNAIIDGPEIECASAAVYVHSSMGNVSSRLGGVGGTDGTHVRTVYQVEAGHAGQLVLDVPLYEPAPSGGVPSVDAQLDVPLDILRSGRASISGDVVPIDYSPVLKSGTQVVRAPVDYASFTVRGRIVTLEAQLRVSAHDLGPARSLQLELPLPARHATGLVAEWEGGDGARLAAASAAAHAGTATVAVPLALDRGRGRTAVLRVIGEYLLDR